MSTSAGSTADGSMRTERISFAPVISIRTRPPPADPVRRSASSSAWTLPCIAWACCIIFWMFMGQLLLFLHFSELRAKELHGRPDDGVRFGAARGALARDRGAGDLLGGHP